MRVALTLTDDRLLLRVKRVLAAFPDVSVDDTATRTAAIGGDDIALPRTPTTHLAMLLARDVERRSGSPADVRAATVSEPPLPSGTAAAFPPPVGPTWARAEGDLLVAPVKGAHAAAMAGNAQVTLAVVDDARFLEAIVVASPILAEARGISELDAAYLAGLSVAERA